LHKNAISTLSLILDSIGSMLGMDNITDRELMMDSMGSMVGMIKLVGKRAVYK